MIKNDLFQPVENQPPQIDESKNYLTELVGEGKKFKTPEDLAKGKAQADAFVDTLKSELDTMRTDYLRLREEHMAGAKLEQLIDQLKKQQQSDGEPTLEADKVKQPEFNLSDLKKEIFADLEKEKHLEKQRVNLQSVQNKLKERHGNNFQGILHQQSETLGMTKEQVQTLASENPNAFYKLFGLDEAQKQESFQSPPTSIQRSSFAPTTEKRTWSWWQNLKREKPKEYWDPKSVTQRHKDALSLGEDFNDGDADAWNRLGNPMLKYN